MSHYAAPRRPLLCLIIGAGRHLLEQLSDLLLVLRAKVLQSAWSRWRWLGLQGELCWGRVRIGCSHSLSRARRAFVSRLRRGRYTVAVAVAL